MSEPTRYESHQWTGGEDDENHCAACHVTWADCDDDCLGVPPMTQELLAEAWERGYAAGVLHVPGAWTPNPYMCSEAVYTFGLTSQCELFPGHEGDHCYAFETGAQ